MNTTKNDLRYQKTERAIQQAFWTLMKEVGFDKLSVQNIVNIAQINRSTFYDHYCDKYELLDAVENNIISDIDHIMENVVTEVITTHAVLEKDLHSYLAQMLSYFYNHGENFSLLMNKGDNFTFQGKLQNKIKDFWSETDISDSMIIPEKYALIATSAAISNMIIEWIHSDFEYTTEEFASYIYAISNMFISGLTNIPIRK